MIATGVADVVVGTHAIIQDAVEFYDLAFVVADEQHRFGVEQRAKLAAKEIIRICLLCRQRRYREPCTYFVRRFGYIGY